MEHGGAEVEGVTAPIVDVVLAEAGDGAGPPNEAWVAANLAAVTEAIDGAHAEPLTAESLCRWHRTLMTGSPTPARHIGGTSPLDAHLVTPPPERVPELLDELVSYVNTGAAIAHAQFELIHPFADGNGRVGRVLIAWMLVRQLSLAPPPPVSPCIAADVGGYSSGLTLFRLGEHERWVRWFAEAVSVAGRAQQELVIAVRVLARAWQERLAAPREGMRRLRRNAAAWRALDLVPRHVVLTGPVVASELGIPLKSAGAALRDLVAAGFSSSTGRCNPQGVVGPAGCSPALSCSGWPDREPARGRRAPSTHSLGAEGGAW